MKHKLNGAARESQLAQLYFVFWSLSRTLALRDFLAEFARMLAIESFAQRFSEGGTARIARDHPSPGHGLQQRPVQPYRTGQRQHQKKFGKPQEHWRNLIPTLRCVKKTPGLIFVAGVS